MALRPSPAARMSAALPGRPGRWLLAVAVLLIVYGLALQGIGRESLWNDEAWTAWAVQPRDPRLTLERVRQDVHPPLYFLAMEGWTLVAGNSETALRLPSAWAVLIALVATYALGRRLFDHWTGLIALIVLGTASFTLYYAREARMYALLLALAALASWFYLRWRSRPSFPRALIYALSLAALLYTHYSAALLIASHLLHALVTLRKPRLGWRGLIPYGVAALLFAPWLPIMLAQIRANPSGPLAIPVPTNLATLAALVLILTSAHPGLTALPALLGAIRIFDRKHTSAVLLLVLWFIITPVALLTLNALVAPVYQVRYVIAILPAGALLVAVGLRSLRLMAVITPRLQTALIAALLGWLAYTQVAMFREFWSEKSPWQATMQRVAESRQPLDLIITDFAPISPAAYYDQRLHLRSGFALDLSWRLHSFGELRPLLDRFADAPSVWVALPINTAKTWHIAALLDQTRHIAYRDSLINMIFYRFDLGNSDDLAFQFGSALRVRRSPDAAQQFFVRPGDLLCVEIDLEPLQSLDGSLSAGLHLVDLTGNRSLAQHDAGLGTAEPGQPLAFDPCLTIPSDAPPGAYHLELAVYNWATLERLPVWEGADATGWGDVLMLAAVDVLDG
ncbi:MAG: glycosyltransferase family 39 protein [Anaerolineae bacterium]|nr:glycosyltransferase family 39 protein [Anaerolineae bacterium]